MPGYIFYWSFFVLFVVILFVKPQSKLKDVHLRPMTTSLVCCWYLNCCLKALSAFNET